MIDRIHSTCAERCRDIITWAVAEAPFPNERESGDRCVVQLSADGILIAAVDGTGHGIEAAAALKIAAATLEAYARESPIAWCSGVTRSSSGEVMTLARHCSGIDDAVVVVARHLGGDW
jgi:hypothetical protein